MRQTYHAQVPLTSANPHPRAAELCAMNAVLDANVGVLRRGARRPASAEESRCKAWTRRHDGRAGLALGAGETDVRFEL